MPQIWFAEGFSEERLPEYDERLKVLKADVLLAKCHYHSFLYTIISNGSAYVIQKKLKNSQRPHSLAWFSTFEQAFIAFKDIIFNTNAFPAFMKQKYNPDSIEACEKYGLELRYYQN